MDFLFGDLENLIQTIGLVGIFAIVFAESGLFMGFFLPGDSLLFTAGFLASQGFLNILTLISVSFAGAVLGDSFGYTFGKKIGPALFKRADSILFHKKNLERAENFYKKYGKKTIILARFLPVVRTFAPILAGVGKMSYPVFLLYNTIGGALWAVGLPLLGYFLGSAVPNVDRYLIPIILTIISISLLPVILHILRNKETRDQIINFLKNRGQ